MSFSLVDNPIQALVLNRYRYGETSLILKLFTEKHGLIGGVLKGAFSGKKWIPEVGAIIEMVPIRKRDEGLFSLGSVEYEYQYGFVDSLLKASVRDTAFELTLAILHEEDPHVQLYELLGKFLHHLETCEETTALFALWLFILRLGDSLGISFERTQCVTCGETLINGGEVTPERGGFTCPNCRPSKSPLFGGEIISLLATGKPSPEDVLPTLTTQDCMGVTTLLIENLRVHFGFHREIRSLSSLKDLV